MVWNKESPTNANSMESPRLSAAVPPKREPIWVPVAFKLLKQVEAKTKVPVTLPLLPLMKLAVMVESRSGFEASCEKPT
jgi:hypothetical protein